MCNHVFRGRARKYIKKAQQSISTGDIQSASEATRQAASELDRAAEGVIHKNNAARRKSCLMKRMNALEKKSS